jgi:HD-like signal output (HDOD) protein
MQADKEDLIANLKKIPPLSAALQQTLNLLNEQNNDWKKISNSMLKDPVLLGRVLQIANSSFYGSQRRVTDIGIACTMLGLETLRGLLYTLLLLSQFRRAPENSLLDYDSLWKHCLNVACLAKVLAKTNKQDANTAFTAGLFHCMDIIIQDHFYPDILVARAKNLTANESSPTSNKIMTMINSEYWSFIVLSLEYWQFPEFIISIFREPPTTASQAYADLVKTASAIIKNKSLDEDSEATASNFMQHIKDSELLYAELAALYLH